MKKILCLIIGLMVGFSAFAAENIFDEIVPEGADKAHKYNNEKFEEICQILKANGVEYKINDTTEKYRFIKEFRNLTKEQKAEGAWLVIRTDTFGNYDEMMFYLFKQTGVDKQTKQPIYTMRTITWRKLNEERYYEGIRTAQAISTFSYGMGQTIENIANTRK